MKPATPYSLCPPDAEASSRPQGEKQTAETRPPCPPSLRPNAQSLLLSLLPAAPFPPRCWLQAAVGHSHTCPSLVPVASRAPSGLNSRQLTRPPRPSSTTSVSSSCPRPAQPSLLPTVPPALPWLAGSSRSRHSRAVPSREPLASREPQGLQATAVTMSLWPGSSCSWRPVAAHQMRTVASAPAVATS